MRGQQSSRPEPVAITHIHAIARDPSDGVLLLAAHEGLYLPQPLGLIRSADRGRTWQITSRGGVSDFHALTAGPQLVAGFDGALRTTTDEHNWRVRGIPAPPRSLAASPTSGTLVATTEMGLLRSSDSGTSWQALATPEPAVLASWADETTLVIITIGGRLATSTDRGASWTRVTRRRTGRGHLGRTDQQRRGRGAHRAAGHGPSHDR